MAGDGKKYASLDRALVAFFMQRRLVVGMPDSSVYDSFLRFADSILSVGCKYQDPNDANRIIFRVNYDDISMISHVFSIPTDEELEEAIANPSMVSKVEAKYYNGTDWVKVLPDDENTDADTNIVAP